MIAQGIQLEQLFSDFLSIKTGQGNSSNLTHSFADIFGSKLQSQKSGGSRAAASLFGSMKSQSMKELVENLKKHLQSLGLKMNQVSVTPDSLAALKQLLIKKGFNEDAVASLFDQILSASEGTTMPLDDLFQKVLEWIETKEEEGAVTLLPSSAIPFFQTILPMLGLDEETTELSLSYAKTESGNINLERLVSFLNSIGSVNTETGTATKIPDTVLQMMNHLNIPVASDQETMLSLPQFISRLETMLHQNSAAAVSENSLQKDMGNFLNHLQVNPIFAENTALTEKVTLLRTVNPFLATQANTGDRNSLFTGQKGISALFPSSDQASQNPYQSLAGENRAVEKNIQTLLEQALQGRSDKSAASMRDTGSDTELHKTARQDRESGIESGQLLDLKKEAVSMAGSKGNAEKPLPSYLLNQVSRQIVRSFQEGLQDIRLQLKPPHLGRLQIHLKTVNDGLKVSIIAENSTTQKILQTHSAELKTALMEHGIRIDNIDVEIAFNFDQFLAQTRQDSRKSPQNKNQEFTLSGVAEETDVQAVAGSEVRAWTTAGMLDLIA